MNAIVKIEFDVERFLEEVHRITQSDIPFTEAIMIWCYENDVDIQIISSIIKKNPAIKLVVEQDARGRNMIKK